jgi:hypothetical protein
MKKAIRSYEEYRPGYLPIVILLLSAFITLDYMNSRVAISYENSIDPELQSIVTTNKLTELTTNMVTHLMALIEPTAESL